MYSSAEVAGMLKVSLSTLTLLRKKGLIRSVTMHGGQYTSEESLRDYLAGGRPEKKEGKAPADKVTTKQLRKIEATTEGMKASKRERKEA